MDKIIIEEETQPPPVIASSASVEEDVKMDVMGTNGEMSATRSDEILNPSMESTEKDKAVANAEEEDMPRFQLLSLLVFSTIDALVRDWFKVCPPRF